MRMRIDKAKGRFDGLDVADVNKFCKVQRLLEARVQVCQTMML